MNKFIRKIHNGKPAFFCKENFSNLKKQKNMNYKYKPPRPKNFLASQLLLASISAPAFLIKSKKNMNTKHDVEYHFMIVFVFYTFFTLI